MNRREMFKRLAVLPTAVVATRGAESPRFGRLTIGNHRAHQKLTGETLHVYVNGTDVTRSCYEADDVEGYALVYCRDERTHADYAANGHVHAGDHSYVCKFRLSGDVRIVAGDPLDGNAS